MATCKDVLYPVTSLFFIYTALLNFILCSFIIPSEDELFVVVVGMVTDLISLTPNLMQRLLLLLVLESTVASLLHCLVIYPLWCLHFLCGRVYHTHSHMAKEHTHRHPFIDILMVLLLHHKICSDSGFHWFYIFLGYFFRRTG